MSCGELCQPAPSRIQKGDGTDADAFADFGQILVRSAGVPVARTRPASMSAIRSQRAASFMKWVEMKIVTPWLRDKSIRSFQNWSRAIGSTPDIGSSRISISGL